jgi:hypothetical protein
MAEAEVWCYVGRKGCGCPVAATVDSEDSRAYAARDVADWIRRGLTIERRTVEWVRIHLRPCVHEERERQVKQGDLALDAASQLEAWNQDQEGDG